MVTLCLAFPGPCKTFKGPHSMACYIHIWNSSGCSESGVSFPPKQSKNESSTMHRLNLW